jgi:POT family proton-dependent oligopeptide transporter
MGTWFLANSASNKFAGTLSSLYPPGPGEFKIAADKGIDLPGILNGSITATADQIKLLTEAGIPHIYPVFVGMQITNLYDFFMLFVIMSAVASGILFIIYKWLSKMMHGVH